MFLQAGFGISFSKNLYLFKGLMFVFKILNFTIVMKRLDNGIILSFSQTFCAFNEFIILFSLIWELEIKQHVHVHYNVTLMTTLILQ